MNTTEARLLRVEAVGDLPVLWATVQRLDLVATLDRHFPAPLHWKGPLTPGEVLSGWLLYLVSQGDHRLNRVEPWADVVVGRDPAGAAGFLYQRDQSRLAARDGIHDGVGD